MQSQLTHPTAHDQEPEPQVAVHHPEEEEHHEKKPIKVLKKVKEKAKKIKNTLTKLGYGDEHDHDHGEHIPDDHDLNQEDDEDEDEEMVEDPEVHGAPMYESATLRSGITGQPESLSHPAKGQIPMTEEVVPPGTKVFPVVSSGPTRTSDPTGHADPFGGSDREENKPGLHTPQNTPVSLSTGIPQTRDGVGSDDPERTFVPGQEESPGQRKVNLERPRELEEDPAAPQGGGSGAHSSVSNYQTKVADPAGKGGEEAEMDHWSHALSKMRLTEKPDIIPGPKQELPERADESVSQFSTGSHDQFSPELNPPRPIATPIEQSPSEPEASETRKPGTEEEKQPKQSTYTEKITSATSVIADKAIGAKNVVASKLGYGEKDSKMEEHERREGDEKDKEVKTGSVVEYGKKMVGTVTEKLTPVYEKVKETGTNVMTKMPLSETRNEAQGGGQDKGVSVKDYFAEKVRPGEEDRALSEVIAETLQRKARVGEGKDKTKGKVTQSEEVTRKLGGFGEGRSEEEEKHGESFVNNTEMSVVDKLKGAVNSWLWGRTEQQSSQSIGSTEGTQGFTGSSKENLGQTGAGALERKPQESGN